MRMRKWIVGMVMLTTASGCAFGHKIEYSGKAARVGSGSGGVALAVHDQRPAVVDRDKAPHWVGLNRSDYGIPFNVATVSGRPLAEDVMSGLRAGFDEAGYEVTVVRARERESREDVVANLVVAGAPRSVLLTVHGWKTDRYGGADLTYDLELLALDGDGEKLARATRYGTEDLGRYVGLAPAYMRFFICDMLAEEAVVQALAADEPANCEEPKRPETRTTSGAVAPSRRPVGN